MVIHTRFSILQRDCYGSTERHSLNGLTVYLLAEGSAQSA